MNQASGQQIARGNNLSLGIGLIGAFSLVMVISVVVMALVVGPVVCLETWRQCDCTETVRCPALNLSVGS